jgi:hypothetical protein
LGGLFIWFWKGLEPIGENSQWLFEFSLLGRLAHFSLKRKMFAQAQNNSSPFTPTMKMPDHRVGLFHGQS